MNLIFEDHERYETITSKEDIEAFLSTLGKPGNIYAILEDGEAFIQTVGNEKRGFGIQYKSASGELYTAKKLDFTKDQIIHAFQNYYAGNDAWKKSVQWEFDPFEADPSQRGPQGKFAKALYAFMQSEPRPKVKSVKASGKIYQVGRKIFLTLVGIGLITIGLGVIKHDYDLSQYPKTEGVVQSFKVERATEDAPTIFPKNLGCPDHCYPSLNYTPIIQYDVGGVPYELVGSYSKHSQDELHKKYTVVYNPHDPRRAEIYNFFGATRIFSILMILSGAFALYLAFVNTWGNIKNSPKFMGGIWLCIVIIMPLYAGYTTVQNYRLYDAQAMGVVKGFDYYWSHRSKHSRSQWVYSPIVEYLVDGKAYQCADIKAYSNPRYHVHEKIQVAYDPMNPATSVIASELNNGMGILISIGLWCILVAGVFLAAMRRFKFLNKPSVRSATIGLVSGSLFIILYYCVLWEDHISIYKGVLAIFFGVASISLFHNQSTKASIISGVLCCALGFYVFWENNIEIYRSTLWMVFGLSGISLYLFSIQWKSKREKSKKKKPEPRKKFLR